MSPRIQRKAVVLHIAFWNASVGFQTGHRRPGTKVYELQGMFPDHEYPDLIFAADNHPDGNEAGCRNEPIRLLKKSRLAYSLSAGDVIKIGRKFFLCENIGWKQISRSDLMAYLLKKDLLPCRMPKLTNA